MNAPETTSILSTIADRYYADGDATRKAVSYLRTYEKMLQHRRDVPLRILELGVSSGASLLVWRDYLPHATIVGLDIAEMPSCLTDQPRIHFVRGSQDDPTALDHAAALAGGDFDLIVDDAAHIGYLAKRSFNYLFPRWLAPGGVYVIEDIGTAFLPEYPDGQLYVQPAWDDAVAGTSVFRSHQHGMVGFVKQLIDHMMQELSTGSPSYLPIQRVAIESNIAFVEKLRQSAPPVPGPLPSGEAQPRTDATGPELAAITRELASQSDRIGELERVIAQALHPVRLLRAAGRWAANRGRA